jgi:hypothetical protein
MPKSAIERLPLHLRTPALRKLSANANAPGGTKKQTGGRPQRPFAQAVQGRLGIILIEAIPSGPLAVKVGAFNRSLGSGLTDNTIGITGTGAAGSPATFTDSALTRTFTYGGAGVKDITAAMAGDVNATGAARVTV